MSLGLACRSAVWAIQARPARSLALALSLASAVACVVFSASVLGGFSERLERLAFGDYATTLVVRSNGLVPSRRGGPSLDDRARLLETLQGVDGSAAWVETTAPLRGAAETRVIRVFGVIGDYRRELDANLVDGRWLDDEELGGLSRVCLLGASLAGYLNHAETSVVGTEVSLGGPRCRVVGVLDYAESRPAARFNNAAITPFLAARRYFDVGSDGADAPRPREASWLSFFMTPATNMQSARYEADRIMRRGAGVPMSRESPYSYDDPGADIDEQVKQRDALSRLLWTITGAALTASLIGYCGIAFAATAERRREIALRLAMGAKAGDILRQVALEHAMIAAAASLAGLALGMVGASIAAQFWGWPVRMGWAAGGAAVAFGSVVGLLMGLGAAWRSARTSPSLAAKG